jgi:AmmeMemoRadiSam system protein B
MTTVAARWPTPYGTLGTDQAVVDQLDRGMYIEQQSSPFITEHGIFSITPFIARAMPHARIVPLIIKDTAPAAAIREAVALIAGLPGRILLVGSFDFTHDSTMAQAEANDRRSLPIVAGLDEARIDQVAVDSHAGLATFLAAVKARRGSHFTLLDSTHSARLTGHYDQTDVTSYIIGYFTEK